MKLGIIARCDARGIAWQTLEMVRHLNPSKVLCVLMNDPEWPEDVGRFAQWDTTFVDSNLSPKLHERTLDERKCRKFLRDLDVVFAVETVYDWKFIDWAHEAGARVIVHGNGEFYAHHANPDWPHPDTWAWPTPWMRDQLPDGVDLPVPCVERPQTVADPDERTLNVLHVIGKMAANDRNGSLDFIEALPSLRGPTKVRIAVQGDSLPRKVRCGSNVELEVITGSVADRWDLFADCHVLTMPRKYGGLCLPVIEAMACGLTPLMPDISPNEIWPGPRIPGRKGRVQRSPFGKVQTYGVHPIDIAHCLNRLNADRELLRRHLEDAERWASLNSWAELKDRLYVPALNGALP